MTHRNFGEDVKDDRKDGLIDSDSLTSESFSQVFRHRVDVRGNVDRNEKPAEQQDEKNCLKIK